MISLPALYEQYPADSCDSESPNPVSDHELAEQLWILFPTNWYPVKVGLIPSPSSSSSRSDCFVGHATEFIITGTHCQISSKQHQSVGKNQFG